MEHIRGLSGFERETDEDGRYGHLLFFTIFTAFQPGL